VIPANRYKVAVELAEIDWCPRLCFPLGERAAVIEPRALNPPSAAS
jgi:hypothetical protein